jgi:hypothetical protein
MQPVMGNAHTFVAETLGRIHTELFEKLRKLEEAAGLSSSQDLVELRARLVAMHRHIVEHFLFEDQYQIELIRQREPRLDRTIQRFAEEHCQMTESLFALIGEAESSSKFEDELRERVRSWVNEVRQHETREDMLLQGRINLGSGAAEPGATCLTSASQRRP